MMKRSLFLLVITTVISCTKKEVANSENLIQAIQNFNTAFENGDVDKLDKMITNNYIHTNGSWKAFGKEDWLGYMSKRRTRLDSGELRIGKYQMNDLNIEMYGTAAVVTGKITIEGIENGESFSRDIRISNFWVFRNGRWKRAGFHDTRIE